uniref:G-protein coupled receptors family 2 profile 1 domain-containing protein n=1 Tax=Naja naja TaxID=35670 RepID=A0A8C6YA52_NAJNA
MNHLLSIPFIYLFMRLICRPISLRTQDLFSTCFNFIIQSSYHTQQQSFKTPPLVAEGKFCNRTFDNYVCWPDGIPGTYVNMSCPWYLPSGQVYRFCTLEGTWLMEENSTNPWRNISACMASDEVSKQYLFEEFIAQI